MKFLVNTLKIMLLIFVMTSTGQAKEKAKYYRVWQGFKNPNLTHTKFLNILPKFMEETVDLYKGVALNQYLVAIPPKNAPHYIPHEFALVALHSEKDYRRIRQTDEGRHYSARHWDVFNKNNSKSAPYHNLAKERVTKLTHNHAYDVIGKPLDWTKGHNMFFLGLRKKGMGARTFLRKLKQHVSLVKRQFKPLGMKGYIIIANNNYEVAYINWESKEKMLKAVNSKAGELVWADAGKFLQNLQYMPGSAYSADEVKHNSFIENL